MPMPICNSFHARLANSGKITNFWGYHSLMPSCAGFLEPRKSRLGSLKFTFNAENFICSLSSLPVVILAQFALEMCLAAQNRHKIYVNLYFNVQGHPRSLLSVAVKSQRTTSY